MEIGSRPWRERIRRGAADLGISVTSLHLSAFEIHARELLYWNRKTNLTAVTEPEQLATRHFVDSLPPARWIDPGDRLLDVGSGGGFPGIPLKLILPDISATLIDSSRKKTSFLGHVIRRLGLTGIEAVHTRAEAMAAEARRRWEDRPGYDVIVSRALGPPEKVVPWVLPLLSAAGTFIAMLGQSPPGSRPVGGRIGGLEIVDAFDYRLPGSGAARGIRCLRYPGGTPAAT